MAAAEEIVEISSARIDSALTRCQNTDMREREASTPAGVIFTQMVLETFRLNGLLLESGDRLVESLGLSSSLWQVLGAVGSSSMSISQVARRMGLTRQSVRRSVHVLRDRGLVTFETNPDHRRASLVVMTPRGREVLEEAGRKRIAWSNSVTEDLKSDELLAAVRLLRRLSDLATVKKQPDRRPVR